MSLVFEQLITFLLLTLVGMGIALTFDVYRVLRGQIKPPKILGDIADLLIWVVLAIIAFVVLIFGNWGEVRVYIFIGIIVGIAIYFKWFSKTVINIVFTIFKIIKTCVLTIYRLITIPIKLISGILLALVMGFGKILAKLMGLLLAPFRPIINKLKVIWGKFKLKVLKSLKKD
ncbi:spore cortex biosynthesis protein YabQ [Desulfitispora alkaliphila]|uniref:spore cortex biosynthesis protein YabQ n=1 Tax=Desulfitispora alkaliphila TaxID=622674 RepID=UPI003D22FF16